MNNQIKILIVNDDQAILKLQLKMIEDDIFKIFTALSGKEAYKMIENDKPDIILLDIVMPGESGYEVCKHIKSTPTLEGILVLLVSSIKYSEEDQTKAIEADGDGFVNWPFTKNDLLSRLRPLIRLVETERKLKQSEEKYKYHYNNIPLGIFRSTISGKVLYANPAMVKMYGFETEEELLAQPAQNYYSNTSDREEMLAQLKKHGFVKSFITKELKKDGSVIWVKTDYNAVYNGEGTIAFIDGTIEDISETKEIEEKFKSYIENLPDGFFVIDQQGKYIDINDKAIEISGYTKEEFLTLNFLDLVTDDSKQEAITCFGEVWQHGKATAELSLNNKNGEIKFVLISCVKMSDNRLLVFAKDVTEYRKAQLELKESEDKFRTIFNTINDSIFIHKEDGEIVEFNDTVLERYGYSREELFRLGLAHIDAPEEAIRVPDRIKIVKEKGSHSFETIHRDSKGDNWPVEVSARSVQYSGAPAILSVVRDIGERKKAEQELLRAQETLKENLSYFENLDKISKMLNQSMVNEEVIQAVITEVAELFNCERTWLLYPCEPEAENHFVRYNYDKGKQSKFEMMNNEIELDHFSRNLMKQAEKGEPVVAYADSQEALESETVKKYNVKAQLSVKVETKIGKPWLLGLHQTTVEHRWTEDELRLIKEVGQRLAQALDNLELYKNLQKSEKKVRDYSTNLKSMVKQRTDELELQAKKISESQQALTFLLEDMNEARKDLIFANEELDALNQELESFSYSVSHDLRAPLTRLDGFSRALFDHMKGNIDETAQHYLDRIRLSSQHMGELIKDILTLSRINRKELQVREIDASSLANFIFAEVREASPNRKSKISVEPEIKIHADKTLLEFMMRNLIENAWKFTKKRELTEISVGSEMKDGKTVVFVRDNGIGFNMKYYDQLFAVFRRLHSDQEFPGTGIGLATVQRIVNRHKGEIWAEGVEGEGATFYFSL
ncbi:MAG: PAS domain S-box protein [Bacteroidales bacterium]|nr:PAS domain S-box protein [Bacteroidales bacterium]MCF8455191.1 PAS domain S-box protein [Bacteroidales bacterium]